MRWPTILALMCALVACSGGGEVGAPTSTDPSGSSPSSSEVDSASEATTTCSPESTTTSVAVEEVALPEDTAVSPGGWTLAGPFEDLGLLAVLAGSESGFAGLASDPANPRRLSTVVSSDGMSWTVTDGPPFTTIEQSIVDLEFHGSTLIGVGGDIGPDVWKLEAGSWEVQRVAEGEGMTCSVVALTSRELLVTGKIIRSEDGEKGLMTAWSSLNGTEWTESFRDSEAYGPELGCPMAMTDGETVVVIAERYDSGEPIFWTSSQDSTFTTVSTSIVSPIRPLGFVGDSFYMSSVPPGEPFEAVLWSSKDGANWSREMVPSPVTVPREYEVGIDFNALVFDESGIILVGFGFAGYSAETGFASGDTLRWSLTSDGWKEVAFDTDAFSLQTPGPSATSGSISLLVGTNPDEETSNWIVSK